MQKEPYNIDTVAKGLDDLTRQIRATTLAEVSARIFRYAEKLKVDDNYHCRLSGLLQAAVIIDTMVDEDSS